MCPKNMNEKIYITRDLEKSTKAKKIRLSFESTKRLKADKPPATAALRRSFDENRRIKQRIPLYKEFNKLTNSANLSESMCPVIFIL
jgi:hypothetical protein